MIVTSFKSVSYPYFILISLADVKLLIVLQQIKWNASIYLKIW